MEDLYDFKQAHPEVNIKHSLAKASASPHFQQCVVVVARAIAVLARRAAAAVLRTMRA